MKKIGIIVLMFLGLLTMYACIKPPVIDLLEVLAELEIGFQEGDSANAVTQDITLPTTSTISSEVVISWSSSNPNAVSNQGVVNRLEEDTEVILTATVSLGEDQESDVFIIKVLKAEEVIIPIETQFIEDIYELPVQTEIQVRAVLVDQIGTNRYFVQDETRGILAFDATLGTLFAGVSIGDELIIKGRVDEFSNAQSRQINVTEVTIADSKTLTVSAIDLDDFSEESLRNNINNPVRFESFFIMSATTNNPFRLSNGTDEIYVYLDGAVLDHAAVKTHLSTLVVGQKVAVESAILTYYAQSGLYEVFITHPDQLLVMEITDAEKIEFVENNLVIMSENEVIYDDFQLPATYVYDTVITYSTNHSAISINAEGYATVTRPESNEDDAEVTITYTLHIGEIDPIVHTVTVVVAKKPLELGELKHRITFDNFLFPYVPGQSYREAYQENEALEMLDEEENAIIVYKNRWQLLAPNFSTTERAAAFVPRQGTPGELRMTFTEKVTSIRFEAGMFEGVLVTEARIEILVDDEWVVFYDFFAEVGVEQYRLIEITGVNAYAFRIIVDAEDQTINDNNNRLYIDNLEIYVENSES